MYEVIVCPNCEKSRIIQEKQKSFECYRCGKNYNTKKVKRYERTKDIEKAREALSIVNEQLSEGKSDIDVEIEETVDEASLEEKLERVIKEEEPIDKEKLKTIFKAQGYDGDSIYDKLQKLSLKDKVYNGPEGYKTL